MDYAPLARHDIITYERAVEAGLDHRMLAKAVTRGELVKLRRGVYADAVCWNSLAPAARHVARIRAVASQARSEIVVAGHSAAAVWGMPLAGEFPDEVTLLDQWKGGGRSEPGVRRTAASFDTANIVTRDGIRTTDLARTTLDVARAMPFADAVGSVDWAIAASNPLAIETEQLVSELDRARSRARRRQVLRAIRFASPLSGSFGESKARAVFHELGFQTPELQVEFRDREGSIRVDFLWRERRVIGEFDGRVKYLDRVMSRDDPASVAWREKRREDRLRGMGFGVIRIVWADLQLPNRVAELLDAVGIPRAWT